MWFITTILMTLLLDTDWAGRVLVLGRSPAREIVASARRDDRIEGSATLLAEPAV
jgi:hypothetical protein